MAAITRRTTPNLITEHIQRVGKVSWSAYSARAAQFISFAHRYCGATWHHFELDTTSTSLNATKGSAVVSITSLNALVVTNVNLKTAADDKFISTLEFKEIRSVRPTIERKNAPPERWSRWGNNLVFNCLSDQAYQLDIDYYKRTAELDDASGNLELGEEWDEPVLVLSVAQALEALWNPAVAAPAFGRFEYLTDRLTNPLLADAGLPGEPVRSTRMSVQPHGGKQG